MNKGNLIKGALTVLFSVLLIWGVIKAASTLMPSAPPSSGRTMWTLDDIYHKLDKNAGATSSYPTLDAPAAPDPNSGTMHTLTEIYNAAPAFRTAPGTAIAGDVCNDATFYSDTSTLLTGTRTACSSGGYTYGDSSALKVLVTATGAGTALKNLFNGSTSTNSYFRGSATSTGGIDDCGYNGAACTLTAPSSWTDQPYGTTTDGWTECTSGPDNWCGTGDSGAAYKDNYTGLVWSKLVDNATYGFTGDDSDTMTWFIANNCTESSGGKCTKKTSSKTGCEANSGGWYTPHQKQLMQAYIDGSYGHLEAAGTNRDYWSATSYSDGLTGAWVTGLSSGYTNYYSKTSTGNVRCVRSAI